MDICVDPFSKYDETDPIVCNTCLVAAELVDLHGRMIVYPNGYILAVCPQCNLLAAHKTVISATACDSCRSINNEHANIIARKQHCYIDNRKIHGQVYQQILIDASTRTIVIKSACAYHYSRNVTLL